MDMWGWVDDLHDRLLKDEGLDGHRLAHLIEIVPELVTDNEYEQVDACIPEAMALAKRLRLPWLGVFFRHWDLQSRVLNRGGGAVALADAVELVERAHREDCTGCPQSVCSVQDLAACYGNVDGPGFAKERIEVVNETLARINPRWPCFVCLTSEGADALVDDGRGEDALQFLADQERVIRKAGQKLDVHDLGKTRVEAYLSVQRFREAIALLDKLHDDEDDGHRLTEQQLLRACALQGLGEHTAASAAAPSWAELKKSPSLFALWAGYVERAIGHGAMTNDVDVGLCLQKCGAELWALGNHSSAVDVTSIAARLAIARGGRALAQAAIDQLERSAAQLRDPTRMQPTLVELRLQLGLMPRHVVRANAADVLQEARMRASEEQATCLEDAIHAGIEDEGIIAALVDAWTSMGLARRARALLEDYVVRSHRPGSVIIKRSLAATLRHDGDDVAMQRLLSVVGDLYLHAELRGLWLLQRGQRLAGPELDAMIREAVMELKRAGNSNVVLTALADALHLQGAHEEELALRLQLAGDASDLSSSVSMIVLATRVGRFDVVDRFARRCGLERTNDLSEIELLLGADFEDRAHNNPPSVLAVRRGAAWGAVVVLSPPGWRQLCGANILIDPIAMKSDHDGPPRHQAIAVLSTMPMDVYFIDGVTPSDQVLSSLFDELVGLGVVVQHVFGADHHIASVDMPGMCIGVGVTPDVGVKNVFAVVHKHLDPTSDVLSYAALAQAAGRNDVAAEHQARNTTHGLVG
jgi:hypothetical protein